MATKEYFRKYNKKNRIKIYEQVKKRLDKQEKEDEKIFEKAHEEKIRALRKRKRYG